MFCSRGKAIGVGVDGMAFSGAVRAVKVPGIGDWWKNYIPVFPLILHNISL